MMEEKNIRVKIILLTLLSITALVVNCGGIKSSKHSVEYEMKRKPLKEVLKEYTDVLMSIEGVTGTAQSICNGKPCIKVYTLEKTPKLENKIPVTLEGYPIVIEKTGEIRALPENQK
jgi:hypothetical protein